MVKNPYCALASPYPRWVSRDAFLRSFRRLSPEHPENFSGASGDFLRSIRRLSPKHPETFSETSGDFLRNIRRTSPKHQEIIFPPQSTLKTQRTICMKKNQRRAERPKGLHKELPPGMKDVASLCEAIGLSDSLCQLVMWSLRSPRLLCWRVEENPQHGDFSTAQHEKIPKSTRLLGISEGFYQKG